VSDTPIVSVSVTGLRDVEERLQSLGQVAGTKVMRSVLFTASKPIEVHAKANARALIGSMDPRLPSGSGALEKAIRRVYLRHTGGSFGSGTRFTVSVAPKTKDATAVAIANLVYRRKRPIRGIYWGHLIEWGHRQMGWARRKSERWFLLGTIGKRVEGKGIFASALRSAGPEATRIFRDRIERAVMRALKKQNAAE